MYLLMKKVRSGLLKNEKIGKYFLYAVGELVLVTLGILIALQVNNMELERQFEQEERLYYQTIKNQLNEDRKILESEILAIKGRISDYLAGMQIIESADYERSQELAGQVFRLLEYGDFRRKSSVYQTLVNSGEIKNIKNKRVLANLQEIERSYEISERIEATQANLVMTHTAQAIITIMDFESTTLSSPELVYTPVFKNRFTIAIRLANEKKAEFEHAISVIDNIVDLINQEVSGE